LAQPQRSPRSSLRERNPRATEHPAHQHPAHPTNCIANIHHWRDAISSVLFEHVQNASDTITLNRVHTFRSERHFETPDGTLIDNLDDHVANTGSEPTAYVAQCFERHDIVFLGEFGRSQQGGQFLQELVPALVDAGVWLLAIEWLLADDQELIDSLVTAREYDAELASKLVFRWGIRHTAVFTEYVDVLRAAWRANQRLDINAPSFRVVGLDYELDYDAVTARADLSKPEAWPHLRHRGPAGRAMANVLQREVLATGGRALVVCSTSHALTHHRRAAHLTRDRTDTDVIDGRVLGMGNHVYSWRADRVTTVLLHQPLHARLHSGPDLVFCADGLIDIAFAGPNGPKFPVGFDVTGGPFAQLASKAAHDEPVLGGITNGYVFLESVDNISAPTPCLAAITDEHLEEARRRVLTGSLRDEHTSIQEIQGAIETHAAIAELTWRTIGL